MNSAFKRFFRKGGLWIALVLMLCLVGCQRTKAPAPAQALPGNAAASATETAAELVSFDSAVALVSEDSGGGAAAESAASEQTTETAPSVDSTSPPEPETASIPEDGTYNSKDEVALYIHTYGKLPSNFITKKEAKKLGWTGGNVEDYAPGKSIGGDYFGNYEGLLPEDKSYHECDIDTLGKKSRGAKRIIYSDDGYIYYTGDHYESFELLYEP
jgi:guanyl-specific ribonuclease Sa